MEHKIYNNIMALCRSGFAFGDYHTDSYTLDIKNNIVYLDRNDANPIDGPVLNDDIINYFDKNIYYNTKNQDISVKGITFREWQERGNDVNSLIIDPLFNDPEHGDFSFKSKENINKINFVEFNLTFGVLGNEWRRRAEDYSYHDPIVRSSEYPIVGIESFENGEETYFYRRGNIDKNPYGVSVGITDEKAYSGQHSFKVQHINDGSSYSFGFRTFFRNGTAEFTMMMFLNEESDLIFDLYLGYYVFLKNGEVRIYWDLGDVVGSYSTNKWIKFGIRADLGDSIPNDSQQKYTLIIDENEIDININYLKIIDYIGVTSRGKNTAYFDDFTAKTTQYIEPYFSQFPEMYDFPDSPDISKIPESSQTQNSPDDDNQNIPKKGLNTGQIVGIVIGVIAFIAICIIVTFIIIRMKKNKTSDFLLVI